MATYTAASAAAGIQPRFDVSSWQQTFVYSLPAGLSTSDVILFGKVANNTTVAAIIQNYEAGTGNDMTVTLSLDGTTFGSATAASGIAFTPGTNLPFDHSLSDDAIPTYSYLKGTVAVTSSSATGSLSLTLLCQPKGNK